MLSLAMVQCSQYSIFPAFNVQWAIGIQCWHGSTSWTERHLITQCSFLKSMPPTTWFVLFDVLAMSTWLHAYLLLILYSFRIATQSLWLVESPRSPLPSLASFGSSQAFCLGRRSKRQNWRGQGGGLGFNERSTVPALEWENWQMQQECTFVWSCVFNSCMREYFCKICDGVVVVK